MGLFSMGLVSVAVLDIHVPAVSPPKPLKSSVWNQSLCNPIPFFITCDHFPETKPHLSSETSPPFVAYTNGS